MASFLLPVAATTLLLLVFSPIPSVAEAVLDVDGNAVRNGGNYYIIPQSEGTGGLKVQPNFICPYAVTTASGNSEGTPVTISSPFRILQITDAIPVIFSFDMLVPCLDPLRWWVASSGENGVAPVFVGTPGPFNPSYFFKIEEAETGENAYYIKFCHELESLLLREAKMEAKVECKDVTIQGGNLVVAPNSPYPFTFKKVASSSSASIIM